MADADALLRRYNNSAAHDMQIEVWETDQKAFDQLLEDQRDELRSIRNGAYQVIGMYIMFQGVMFTAVSQNSLLNCSLSWCPASLCAVAYLATIFTVSERFKSEDQLKQEVMGTKLLLSCVTDSLDRVEQLGVDLDLETQHPKLSLPFLGRTNGCKFLLSLNNLLVLTFLTSFSAFVGWFCVSTLCKNCKTCQH